MRNPSATLLATFLTIAAALPMSAQAPTPNTTPGAVVRVVHIRIKPGRADAFWADMRQNVKPVWDAEKAAGIISDYIVATKSTTEGPNDWGVSFQLVYPNWASLDNLASKTDPITLAHYGSAAKRTAAANARLENAETVASFLTRRQTVNPWP
jgi:hypothetical protein